MKSIRHPEGKATTIQYGTQPIQFNEEGIAQVSDEIHADLMTVPAYATANGVETPVKTGKLSAVDVLAKAKEKKKLADEAAKKAIVDATKAAEELAEAKKKKADEDIAAKKKAAEEDARAEEEAQAAATKAAEDAKAENSETSLDHEK